MSGNTSQPSPEKILCILCIDVNQIQIYPCLTMNRFPATRRRGLFQVREILGAAAGDDTLRLVSADLPQAGKITRQVSSRLDH